MTASRDKRSSPRRAATSFGRMVEDVQRLSETLQSWPLLAETIFLPIYVDSVLTSQD